MSTFIFAAQPASATVLHCYASGGAQFDSRTVARVLCVDGVRNAHLVTVGRSPDRWCLVLEPNLSVEQGNAAQLHRLMGAVSRQLGLTDVQLLRPVERRDSGPATDERDWLKW